MQLGRRDANQQFLFFFAKARDSNSSYNSPFNNKISHNKQENYVCEESHFQSYQAHST